MHGAVHRDTYQLFINIKCKRGDNSYDLLRREYREEFFVKILI